MNNFFLIIKFVFNDAPKESRENIFLIMKRYIYFCIQMQMLVSVKWEQGRRIWGMQRFGALEFEDWSSIPSLPLIM